MNTPMSRAQLAEIRARRDAMADVPWGTYRDLGGHYTVQAGAYVSATTGFESSGDVARVIAESEEQGFQRVTFIARAPGDIDALLAEVERLRDEVKLLHRSVDDQLETIQEAALGLAERGDELERLRGELAARLTRAEVLRGAADHLSESCPDHSDAEEVWMDCPCEWADALHSLADESDPAEVGGDGRG